MKVHEIIRNKWGATLRVSEVLMKAVQDRLAVKLLCNTDGTVTKREAATLTQAPLTSA